ncbi:MAG: aminodeoxychorismate synthase component I [Anaerolineales bacterium]
MPARFVLHITPIPFRPPETFFPTLAARPYALWLDSALPSTDFGCYAYLACDPFRVLRVTDGVAYVDGVSRSGNPWQVIAAEWRRYFLPRQPGLPPFQTGMAGFFGYEMGRYLESVPVPPADVALPDAVLGFYDVVLAFDLVKERAWVLASGWPAEEDASRQRRAAARASQMLAWLDAPAPLNAVATIPHIPVPRSDFSRQTYQQAVARVREYILAGDIFQANLSQRFSAPVPDGYPVDTLYRRLRMQNPAPYAGYFHFGDGVIASASPERFLRLDAGSVDTRPIKGTRPRGSTPQEDRSLAAELLASEKDRAENTMIVDLLRNDLSRVCAPGTVHVPRLCGLESYATVHHLVSTVNGALEPGRDALDLLMAAFPGGSITGAPKIRAMEIIAALEPHPRGAYCGSLGYVAFDGDMDTSILIRTLVFAGGRVFFSAGGGVVADSDPQAEYRETLDKARALFTVLGAKWHGECERMQAPT